MATIDLTSDQTIYIQDILPKYIKELFNEPKFDIDKALLRQIKIVANSKKDLIEQRTALIHAIGQECESSGYKTCGPFTEEYIRAVLVEVERDEMEARRKVLGEQESVEMFKSAFANDLVDEEYLTAARAYRDCMTKQLTIVVEAREILLIATEILGRIPSALNCAMTSRMERLKSDYDEVKSSHLTEQEVLKRLTDWKKNPNLDVSDEDELFAFFESDADAEDDNADADGEIELPETADAKISVDNERRCEDRENFVHFKNTKVDSVDEEFKMLAEMAYGILRHEKTLTEIMESFRKEVCSGSTFDESPKVISQYVNHLRTQYPKLKIKIAIKGYNFSLKVMRKTKSVMSLNLLTTLLETVHEMPAEILIAQERISNLSNAIKRICSLYGRCSMAFQSMLNREKELEKMIQQTPKDDYAESLRVTNHLAYNMKELKRLTKQKDEVKKVVDEILHEIAEATAQTRETIKES